MTAVDLNDIGQVEAALGRFVHANVGASVEVRRLRRCSVGFSWLTLAFDLEPAVAEGSQFILQIGPPSGLFAPYSARPQVLALRALAGGGVPVPEAFWHGGAESVFGAPFFCSRRLAGEVLLPWSILRAPSPHTQGLIEQFVDILAAIHAFDWAAGEIAQTASGVDEGNAAARQIDVWSERIARWSQRRFPMLAYAERWLRENAPRAPRVAIVHGDYRIGNFLQEEGRITGILDWELSHLGDPHEDIAWACLPMFNGGARKLFGTLPRAEVYARYEAACGMAVDPSAVHYYEVFSLFKSVAINLGGAYSCESGSHHDLRMAAMGTQIAPTLKQLYRTLESPP